MDDILCFCVPGRPIPKGRIRVPRRGRAYTPQRTRAYERRIKDAFSLAYPRHRPWRGPVDMVVVATCAPPRKWSAAKREEAKAMEWPCPRRPDWDNVGKIVSDALNGLAYADDAQIAGVTITMDYGPEEALTVQVMRLPDYEADYDQEQEEDDDE